MEDKENTILKNRANIFVKSLSEKDKLGIANWQLTNSKGEFDSTHVIEDTDERVPYRFRHKYFINEKTCMKVSVNEFTGDFETSDYSNLWQNCR